MLTCLICGLWFTLFYPTTYVNKQHMLQGKQRKQMPDVKVAILV